MFFKFRNGWVSHRNGAAMARFTYSKLRFFVNWFMYGRLCVLLLLPRIAAPHRTSNGHSKCIIDSKCKNGCTRCSGVCLCMCDAIDVRRVARSIAVLSNENTCMLSRHRDYDPNGACADVHRVRTHIHFNSNSIKICRWKMEAELKSKQEHLYAIGQWIWFVFAVRRHLEPVSAATVSNMGMVVRCGVHAPAATGHLFSYHLSRLSADIIWHSFSAFLIYVVPRTSSS